MWHAGIIQMDVKPSNWLYKRKDGSGKVPEAMLIDFATSNPFQTGFYIKGLLSTGGTTGHQAPEVVRGLAFDTKADMYSFGVTVYVMLTGCLPFPVQRGGSGDLWCTC